MASSDVKSVPRRRLATRTDSSAMDRVLTISSILLWVFYGLGALYIVYCESFFASGKVHPEESYRGLYYLIFPKGFDVFAFILSTLRVLLFTAAAMGMTYYLTNHLDNGGEYLMVLAWALGIFSEKFWLTSHGNTTLVAAKMHTDSDGQQVLQSGPSVPGWMWLAVAIATGFFSGILCKLKDIADGKITRGTRLLELVTGKSKAAALAPDQVQVPLSKRRRGRSNLGVGERLYIVVPFCSGQWFAFILRNGWRGIFVENGIIVFTLAMIGYTMLTFEFIKKQVTPTRPARADGVEDGDDLILADDDGAEVGFDVIDFISKLFTTSFGAVALGLLVLNVIVTTLAIPLLKALFSLGALVSSVGIMVELVMYEMA